VLIDCRTSDLDGAARFWGEALGRSADLNHPSSRGNYRMLDTPPDEPIVEIQRVDHERRVHIDIEADDIAAEVARLTKLGAKMVDRLERWVVIEALTGQRFAPLEVMSCVRSSRKRSRRDHPSLDTGLAVQASPAGARPLS
jgi:Glyoxalase-like domain